MNYIFITPNFPENFKRFVMKLSEEGINVLGIGDASYEELDKEMASKLGEYYKVDNMEDYNQVFKACAFLSFKHGKIDRLESHNEHWLRQDSRLREDFNIDGAKVNQTNDLQSKIYMKKVFDEIGLPTIKGVVANSFDEASGFANQVGYPVVVKPNVGVGAADTFIIRDERELGAYYSIDKNYDVLIEEYIDGHLETYDGLVDKNGEIVLRSSFLVYEGIVEAVLHSSDVKFYVQSGIFEDLKEMGSKIVDAFNLEERFFHIEFFRKKDGTLLPLEINCRAPGGPVLDLMSIAFDFDIYELYAKIVAGEKIKKLEDAPYYCGYVGLQRGDSISHKHDRNEIMLQFADVVVDYRENPDVFEKAMGKYYYILKSNDLSRIKEAVDFISERS